MMKERGPALPPINALTTGLQASAGAETSTDLTIAAGRHLVVASPVVGSEEVSNYCSTLTYERLKALVLTAVQKHDGTSLKLTE